MATTYNRRQVASFCKSQDKRTPEEIQAGKPKGAPYIKFSEDVSFKKGDFLNVESQAYQLESINFAINSGKLTGDKAEKALERAAKIPEWVLGEVQQIKIGQ